MSPEHTRAKLAELLDQRFKPFQKLKEKWSKEKALSYVIKMEKFDIAKIESEMPKQATLWWSEVHAYYPPRTAKQITNLFMYYCVYAQQYAENFKDSGEPLISNASNDTALLVHRTLHRTLLIKAEEYLRPFAVSYTHLTLPTICSV